MGIFPDEAAVIRLIEAISGEQHDAWRVGKRHFGTGLLEKLNGRSGEERAAPVGG